MNRTVRIVAEIGQAKGDPQYVADAVKAFAAAGCWGVKLQLLQPERIAQADAGTYWPEERPDIPDQRANFARTGCLPYDPDVLGPLVSEARRRGVELYASPFDGAAVDAMVMAGMGWCKIASGDITNEPLVRQAAVSFPGRLIMATGAATFPEIDRALTWVHDETGQPVAWLLACSLAYPTPHDVAEIARVATLRHAYGAVSVGYSDHTHGVAAAPVAVGAGAAMLEKHATLDRSDPDVPDNAFALEPWEMGRYVELAERAALMRGAGLLMPTAAERPARTGAFRSVCAAVDLPAGATLTSDALVPLRPVVAGAFEADEYRRLIGARLTEPVAAGSPIMRSMVAS